MAASSSDAGSSAAKARRLEGASSLYLREAAQQGIDWFPWGAEPFALARRTRRPILLDVGASWCHWCHVMDDGTYSDEEVARLIGQHFVAVKVDRDERPEVDRRYQREVGTLTGEGGWPLTAFLTPEGETFLGGTYFPPEDAVGRPGFRRVLREVARLWKEEPERIRENAQTIRAALARSAERPGTAPEETAVLASVRNDLAAHLDPTNGGFGDAPKFFHPEAIRFWLVDGTRSGNPQELLSAQRTLRGMADGGVYDQVGGGFHRYAVDAAWRIPHFEKMGNDNAELLGLYAQASLLLDDPRFPEVARRSLAWIEASLADPEGGFATSQDADNAPGDDGDYYTWTRSELRDALDPPQYRLLARCFGLGTEGRMPHNPDRNVLFRLLPPEEAAEGVGITPADIPRQFEAAVTELATVRGRRTMPKIDHALYAGVNGLFIRSLAEAGRSLRDERAVALARRAADRFLQAAYDPTRGIAHQLTPAGGNGWGLLEDQIEFARGLLELSATTVDARYLGAAREILRLVRAEFTDPEGCLFEVAPRVYEEEGTSSPAPGTGESPKVADHGPHAAMAIAHLRIGSLTGEAEERDSAERYLGLARQMLRRAGLFEAGTALAILLRSELPARVVVQGGGSPAEELTRAAWESGHPNLAVFRGTPAAPFALPDEQLEAASSGGERTRALLCFGTHCEAPITDPKVLRDRLRRPTATA